jgi:tRNA threonylcarbamoyladenosine biosynthesis protein TsaB
MKILALEFSSSQRSVAVVSGDQAGGALKVSEAVETGPDTARSLAMIETALNSAGLEREEIECIAVGVGPGSYTGVRAAIALAQGWQLAHPVKLLGIASADQIAAAAQSEGMTGRVNVVIDAQRGEFYLAAYDVEPETFRTVEPLRIVTLAEVRERESRGERLIGPEVTRWIPSGRIVFPRAAVLGRLGLSRSDFIFAERLEPIYLREASFVKAPPPRVVS